MEQVNRKTILDTIGHTPMVELVRMNPNPAVRLFVKLEGNNPGGSVKDRVALYMIEGAERRGELKPGMIILEATSGNTGIGISLVAACKGYRTVLTMSEGVSIERRRVLSALGAEIILTPEAHGTDGAIVEARRMLEEAPGIYYMPDQFNNQDNIEAHVAGTGPEIYEQTGGEVDWFVAGIGTTGTLMGVSRYLKGVKPSVSIVGVEPKMGHKVQGLKNMSEAIVPGIYEPAELDRKVLVQDEDAYETSKQLSNQEGIFAGMSSGAALKAAIDLSAELDSGTIVALLPDRGDRYVTTVLYCNERCRKALCRVEQCLECPGMNVQDL
ncbi:MAG: cysteine synthase family protein [bacterium]|nr:cysteine synthase family protein [bacterium]MDT8395071.1 cysteine synthase family protein [bacterium]